MIVFPELGFGDYRHQLIMVQNQTYENLLLFNKMKKIGVPILIEHLQTFLKYVENGGEFNPNNEIIIPKFEVKKKKC